MRIAEIFRSLQGEGFWTGADSVFVRTSGCNLRCWYCDTPYTSWEPEGEDLSLEEILGRVDELRGARLDCGDAVLTGGEPMLFAELVPLAAALRQRGMRITIETAGTLDLPVACDLMSISPKFASSTPPVERDAKWHARHERSRHAPEVIRRLVREYSYQIKFVVDTREDFDAVETWLAEFPEVDRERVLLMPQGVELAALNQRSEWLEPYCRERGLRFCPRKHIEWFGNVRGT